jgi:hypothetical protein
MKKYSVLIADKALRDMEAIYQYIALELLSPEIAMRQYNRISGSILSLEAMPERIKNNGFKARAFPWFSSAACRSLLSFLCHQGRRRSCHKGAVQRI